MQAASGHLAATFDFSFSFTGLHFRTLRLKTFGVIEAGIFTDWMPNQMCRSTEGDIILDQHYVDNK